MSSPPASSGPGRPARTSVWTRPVRGSRGPAPSHSRETIVATAVALADAGGLAAVSMRAVAAALGTGAGSLYRYLASRDDLLDLMSDAVVAELRPHPPAAEDWRGALVQLGRRQLALHRRHPWLLDLMPRPSGIGPESLAWFDACLRLMEPSPSPPRAKFEAIALMTGVVSLVAREEEAPRASPFAGLDLTAHPHLAAALAQPAGRPPKHDLFERTLRILLAGLLADPSGGDGPV